ncbi:hypothetical protein AC1031_002656 [Aphanomyces cochlioides]|nr:hypothetical protein AC1031_002656 [Aphanomyces cochlioides]
MAISSRDKMTEPPPTSQASSLTAPLLEASQIQQPPISSVPFMEHEPSQSSAPRPTKHWRILLSMVALAGATAGVLVGTGVFTKSVTPADFEAISPSRDSGCPVVAPSQRVVEYWPSSQRSCSSAIAGVTHVVLEYVEVSGKLNFDMENTLAKCLVAMRQKCVYVMGALASDKTDLTATNTPSKAVRWFDRYPLDGFVILSSSTSSLSSLQSAVRAISSAVKSKSSSLLVALDVDGAQRETFPTDVVEDVDWVNVRLYNAKTSKSSAIYDDAAQSRRLFDQWQALMPLSKLCIGICVDCSVGLSLDILTSWTQFAHSAGGVTIDSSSGNSATSSNWNDVIQAVLPASSNSTVAPTTSTPTPQSTLKTNQTTTAKPGSKCGNKPRLVEFWGSEVDGCDSVPYGVTHVILSFALVQGGVVIPSFQGSDASVKSCVTKLHSKCISVMGSIGGDTNRDEMAVITDASAFASSALALVEKFGLDGVDIDDEARGSTFVPSRVVAYMKALSSVFKPKNLLVSFDSYMYEADSAKCSSNRCFPTGVEQYVDWINVMAYNVSPDANAASAMYVAATQPNDIFSAWAKLATASKIVLGVCTTSSNPLASGCSYGPGPSNDVVAQWAAWSKSAGGMMVWSGSKDSLMGFALTKYILSQTS